MKNPGTTKLIGIALFGLTARFGGVLPGNFQYQPPD